MFVNKKIILALFIHFIFFDFSVASENYFEEAKKKYDNKDIEVSKFLFQKNIVFNPKDSNSYLYLAKIYKIEENEKETEKNLNSTLLIDPSNEEAMYMKMDIELTKSNFSKVKELKSDFEKICDKLCDKITSIQERLKNFDSSNES